MKVLLLTPPMTQINTPYPATAYLTGFLRSQKINCTQEDPALLLFLKLFSKQGLTDIFQHIQANLKSKKLSPSVKFFCENHQQYISVIEPVIEFLQGQNQELSLRIITRHFLPEGPRFSSLDNFEDLSWAFGALGQMDQAKHFASLLIDDIADVIKNAVDERFELSRYAEKISSSIHTFDFLQEALQSPANLIDQCLEKITLDILKKHSPTVVGITIPFPGNLYAGLRIAKMIRKHHPQIKIILGGGYVNTELRELKDPRIFDYVDFITLDDGEKPLLLLLDFIQNKIPKSQLMRTYHKENNQVIYSHHPIHHDIPHKDIATPIYEGLPLSKYVSMVEMLNPMHRLWSDGKWLKLNVAHGCYWNKCTFCDTSLDYIGRYDPAKTDVIIQRIENLIHQTGIRAFHFIDEAAPPAALKSLAQALIEKQIHITWWGNIRFEKAFTPEVCKLLAKSGCVAVSGGLEVASDRLLKLINKGVTVEQVARVTQSFSKAGVMVHAYLMYGFPTQTIQETVDSLEKVRQLFLENCIQSAFWHRFSATVHSPIGKNPQKFSIELLPQPESTFGKLDLPFYDPTNVDHQMLGEGLRKALYNYMHGVALDEDVRVWFDQKVPKAKVPTNFVLKALSDI